jgi:hypothetical protein
MTGVIPGRAVKAQARNPFSRRTPGDSDTASGAGTESLPLKSSLARPASAHLQEFDNRLPNGDPVHHPARHGAVGGSCH